jgi:iron complex transport system substrate-binding protein
MIVSLEPHTLDDVLATIRLVARLAGVEPRGEELAADLAQRLERVVRPTQRRRVALIEWLEPLFAPGHWVPEQIERAGGTSVIGQVGERSREASWEDVAEADPEVIVLGLCGFDLDRSVDEWGAFTTPEVLRTAAAWSTGELWAIDGSAYASRPGPRLVDGVEVLAAILAEQPDERAVRLPRRA